MNMQGLYTAQITPFKDGRIDYESFEKMIYRQIEASVDGIVVGGSTGEIASLSRDEISDLLTVAKGLTKGRTQLIAGINANIPSKAIEDTATAEKIGVDGLLCVTPFYNRPPQRGLIEYFNAIHDSTSLPIMLYSVPARCGVDFSDETIIELAKLPRIVALKDASGDIERPLRLKSLIPQDFNLLTGEDTNTVAFHAHSGNGCVSVISNIVPKLCKDLQVSLTNKDFSAALELQAKLLVLCKAIFVDTNPIPIKYAASIMNLCASEVRAPLYEITNNTVKDNISNTLTRLREEIDLS